MALSAAGCGGNDDPGPGTTVHAVEVSPSSSSLPAGQSEQLSAGLTDEDGNPVSGRTVTWTSSIPGVAAVSASGLVTATTTGQATITATVDGASGTAVIAVVPAAASVALSPSPASVAPGRTVRITAVVRDADGRVLTGRTVAWSTSAALVARVDDSGLVTGMAAGSATITAAVEGVEGSVAVAVDPAAAVASVVVTPNPVSISQGGSAQLVATVRNAAGDLLEGRPVQWASEDPSKVTVTEEGLLTAVATGGPLTITAAAEGVFGTTEVTVTPPAVTTIAIVPGDLTFVPGGVVTFAAQPRDAGGNLLAGRTVEWTSSNPAVVSVGATQPFDQDVGYLVEVSGVAAGSATLSAAADGVTGTVTLTLERTAFDSISSGSQTTCGLTGTGAAYCWGVGDRGQLGAGFLPTLEGIQATPILAQPALTLAALSVGSSFVCGLTGAGQAWCWGAGLLGALGTGTVPADCNPNEAFSACSPEALQVVGGHTFTQITAGGGHACGLDGGGLAWCWGLDGFGQTGNDASSVCASYYPCTLAPAAVLGGHVFAEISAGGAHTCARTSAGTAYCWGSNESGQLGNPAAGPSSSTPVLVAGGLTFVQVRAGGGHTCALVASGAAYCWGSNLFGELGTGAAESSAPTPQAVFGGLVFSSIEARFGSTCGLTASGARCWGRGDSGELGTGSASSSNIPAVVTGGIPFNHVSPGGYHGCGLSSAGVTYCWGTGEALGTGDPRQPLPVSLAPVPVVGQP